jgi:signal transduction histidine kinase
MAAAIIASTVCQQVLGTLRTRAAAGRLVEQMSDSGVIPVGGPILEVHFAAPDESEWLDAEGHPAQPIEARCKLVVLSDESGPVVRLALSPHADDYSVLSGFTPARRLALRNAQLVAVVNSHIALVQDSGRRLVAVSDTERQRIERDLHDGAQQRLVSAAFHLKVARSLIGSTAVPRQLDVADQLLLDTLAKLRTIAHGMFPTALIEEGLFAALEEIVSAADLPTILSADPQADFGSRPVGIDVAMAAFATVNDALHAVADRSPAARADVSVRREEGVLTVLSGFRLVAILSTLITLLTPVIASRPSVVTSPSPHPGAICS